MVKAILSLAFILILNLSVIAQAKLIVLHSVVGDTIDKSEQQEFLLFSRIVGEDFLFATVHHEGKRFFVKLRSKTNDRIVELKKEEVHENMSHVRKLLRYKKRMAKRKDRAARKLKLPDLRFDHHICEKQKNQAAVNDPMANFYLNQNALQTEVYRWNKSYADDKNCRYTDSPVVNTMIQILLNSEN